MSNLAVFHTMDHGVGEGGGLTPPLQSISEKKPRSTDDATNMVLLQLN